MYVCMSIYVCILHNNAGTDPRGSLGSGDTPPNHVIF